jgi:23S rRNA pseudouridine1911/1915/1917 synthase
VEQLKRQVRIPDELAGQRLDQAAARLMPEFSRSRLKGWIEAGALTVAGQRAAPRTKVKAGDELALAAELPPLATTAPEAIEITVVHRDAAVLVIDKPAGLVVHPGAGNPKGTLQNALLHLEPELARLPRAGIIHRLDKDTSGLLVVARTEAAHHALTAQLARREIRRMYQGVCQSVLTGGGLVDAPIGRHRRDRLRMAVVVGGREARTRYRVIERFRAHSHVSLELETGRTHQIRVHMAHIRAPLVGDPLYGGRPRLPPKPSLLLIERLRGLRRQALHAAQIEFSHPESGQASRHESPLPADLSVLLEALRADARAAEP